MCRSLADCPQGEIKDIQMALHHVERCATSFIIRKMQIKTTKESSLTYQINKDSEAWKSQCQAVRKRTVTPCWWGRPVGDALS